MKCEHPLDQRRDINAMLVCGVCKTYLGMGDSVRPVPKWTTKQRFGAKALNQRLRTPILDWRSKAQRKRRHDQYLANRREKGLRTYDDLLQDPTLNQAWS